VNVLIYGNDPTFAARSEVLLHRLARLHVNALSLVLPLFEDTWTSSSVITTTNTLSDHNIEAFAALAHKWRFELMLRPILDEHSLNLEHRWRGSIEPADISAWFVSYTKLITHYARVADTAGFPWFDIGTELTTLTNPSQTKYWDALIARVRTSFHGRVLYSANHDAPFIGDTGFWSELDAVGIDGFWSIEAPLHPTVQDLTTGLQYVRNVIIEAGVEYGKPVILTEVGMPSEQGAFLHPWIWDDHTTQDLLAQQRYYQSVCTLRSLPVLTGLFYWLAGIYPLADPQHDTGYEFLGKPAATAVNSCYVG
jgi:hypothetical protein